MLWRSRKLAYSGPLDGRGLARRNALHPRLLTTVGGGWPSSQDEWRPSTRSLRYASPRNRIPVNTYARICTMARKCHDANFAPQTLSVVPGELAGGEDTLQRGGDAVRLESVR